MSQGKWLQPPPTQWGAAHRCRGGGAPPVRWSPPPWRPTTSTPGLVWAQCTGCCPGVFAPQALWCMQGLGGWHRALVGVQWAAMAGLLGTTATAMAAHVGPYCRHGDPCWSPAVLGHTHPRHGGHKGPTWAAMAVAVVPNRPAMAVHCTPTSALCSPPQPLHAPQVLGCKHPRTAPCTLSPHKPWGGGYGPPWRR